MVDVRPMTAADAPGCAHLGQTAFTAMRRQYGLPVAAPSDERTRRDVRRFERFLATDPAGSFVATDGDGLAGFCQAIVRDGLWMLSMLAVDPARQSAGVGRRLLDAALTCADPGAPGMILCSRDPRAARRYAGAGFQLHPAVTAWGPVDPTGLPDAGGVRPAEPTDAAVRATVAEVDRAVRGASRADDVQWLLAAEESAGLLLCEDQGYVVMFDGRPYALAARTDDAARRLLAGALRHVPAGRVTEVGWLTSGQQWAMEVALAGRLELHPVGPYCTRHLPGPFVPAIACGAFG